MGAYVIGGSAYVIGGSAYIIGARPGGSTVPTLTTHSSTMGLLVNAGNSGGVSLFTYANPNIATAQVTGTDFWITPKFPLKPLDVIWCQLSDGFVKLSMTTATTAEAV